MAVEVGIVVVWIMWAIRVELPVVVVHCAFAVHSPEESKDECDHPQHHTAEGERLQAALGRGQEGCGASGHNEEGSNEDGSVVQGRHPVPGLELLSGGESAGAGRLAGVTHFQIVPASVLAMGSDCDQTSRFFTPVILSQQESCARSPFHLPW